MGLFDNIFRRKRDLPQAGESKEERSYFGDFGLGYNVSSLYSNSQAMKLSTVYACTNILSNSVALLPVKVVKVVDGKKVEIDHPLTKILNLSPNGKYNKFNFFKLLIESVILNGNGYALIIRDEHLNVKSLELLDPAYVNPIPQEDGSVKYVVQGINHAVDANDIIHLYQHCDSMMNGISVIKYASMALKGAYDKEVHSDTFYAGGGGLMGIIKAAAPLTSQQKYEIAQSWERSMAKTANGGVAILPQGLDFQAIAVSPEDAQLLESRQFDVISLCRYFNVSPLKVFDYSHMSYSSLEQVSLSYLQDSVLPYTQLIEDEFNRKIFRPSEVGNLYIDFDYAALMSADKKTEAEYYRTLITNGVVSLDEVREKLGFAPMGGEEGSAHFIQVSYGNLKDVVAGNFIKQQTQNPNTQQDNKLGATDKE